MRITYINGTVRGPAGIEAEVNLLIDSGATYSLLTHSAWEAIGLVAKREMIFTLADGATVQRRISECYLMLPQGGTHTPVILGEADDEALLGVVTLEELGLLFNPFNRTLQPMPMMLA
ncbi:MAG: aspartyl protease [SAR202 cluster bacterium Io17-Chloro-G7]|nr:MAG: aspartyl protease [SAR202 cluster bacterium Io17-Chloro-G7]